MKLAGAGAAVVLLCQAFNWAPHCAADPGVPAAGDEFTKQKEIYLSRGEQRPQGYVVDRTLSSYSETLLPEFETSLAKLGSEGRWLDIGAGTGQAILDYFSPAYDKSRAAAGQGRRNKARAVAISIEDRRTAAWHQTVANLGENRIRYLFSKTLREYAPEELGQFRIITDVIGGFSYTPNLSLFVQKVLALLETDGSFYTVLQDVRAEDGKNKPHYKGAPFLTEIYADDGAEIKVCSWLKSIACVKVTCEYRTGWTPQIEVYRLHKVCNDVTVPTLIGVHYQAGTPPERAFQLK